MKREYRFRDELKKPHYDILTKDEVVELLQIVANENNDPAMRRDAKERLLDSYTRLIYGVVVKRLGEEGVGIEDRPSEVFNSVANGIFQNLTRIAVDSSGEQNFTFATAVIKRTHDKIVNKIKAANAQKRGRDKTQQQPEDQRLDDYLVNDLLPHDRLLMTELALNVREAIDQLDEVEKLIVIATHGVESGEGMTIREASQAIDLSREDGKKAWERAKTRLRKLCDESLLDD